MYTLDFLTGIVPDYATIHNDMFDIVRDLGGEPSAGKLASHLGFDGIRCRVEDGTLFYGTKPNGTGYIWVSGSASHRVAPSIALSEFRATRLDIAMTKLPSTPASSIVYAANSIVIESDASEWGYSKLARRIWESDTGITLYLGAPSSPRMLRMYDKDMSEEEPRALRIEWQLRHHIAERCFDRYRETGNAALREIWLEECSILPSELLDIVTRLTNEPHYPKRPNYPNRHSDIDTGLDYLERTITPLIARLVRGGASELVDAWYNEAMNRHNKKDA